MIDQTGGRGGEVQATKPAPRAKPKPQYIYHWDRIVGALAALGLLIGVIGFGLYTWLRPSLPPASVGLEGVQGQEEILVGAAPQSGGVDREPLPSLRAPAIAAADRQTGPEVPVNEVNLPGAVSGPAKSGVLPEPEVESTPQQSARKDVAVDLPRLVAVDALPKKPPESPEPAALPEMASVQTPVDEESALPPLAQAPVREEVAEVATAPAPEADSDEEDQRDMDQGLPGEDRPEPSAAVAPDTPAEVGSESVSEPGSSGVTTVTDQSEETSGMGHFRSQNTSISSPAVRRFVLAQSVRNNEPKGNLGDIIPNARGVAEVFSYSEVTGLEGEVLEYRWLHEGEQVLKIRVPVGAERWRSHSTKRIYPKMKGAWRAELRDSAGNLLASIDFVF